MKAANLRNGPEGEGQTVKPEASPVEQSFSPAPKMNDPHPARPSLWEGFRSRENLARALTRVERNAGAPGPDGMTTQELRPWLHVHWPQVRKTLDAGTYRPSPVRRVTIPKPGGGVRLLGVPTVLDRLLQQALSQVLTPAVPPVPGQPDYRSPGHAMPGELSVSRT